MSQFLIKDYAANKRKDNKASPRGGGMLGNAFDALMEEEGIGSEYSSGSPRIVNTTLDPLGVDDNSPEKNYRSTSSNTLPRDTHDKSPTQEASTLASSLEDTTASTVDDDHSSTSSGSSNAQSISDDSPDKIDNEGTRLQDPPSTIGTTLPEIARGTMNNVYRTTPRFCQPSFQDHAKTHLKQQMQEECLQDNMEH